MEQLKCNSCGAIDQYYTTLVSNNNVARCKVCDAFIKNIPYDKPKMYVGKYKNQLIENIEDMGYLKWALANMTTLTKSQRDAIENRINQFENLAR